MNKTKTFITDTTQILRAFLAYMQRNKITILLLSLFTFLIHGSKLYSINLGIDTEKVLDDPEDIYNSWHSIGRYGLTTIKQLLAQADFNPYFAGILTILLLIAAMVAFGFLFTHSAQTPLQRASQNIPTETSCQSHQESIGLFLFGATVIAHPIMTEQLYFSLQGVEVTLSFLLCAVSLLFAHEWCLKKELLRYVCAVLFLPLIFSVYQSFVPLYIFGAIALCCLYLPFSVPTHRVSSPVTVSEIPSSSDTPDFRASAIWKKYFLYIGQHIIVFASGLLINQLITNRFFGQSSYLTNQIYWDKNNLSDGFRRILSHIASVCLGYGDFYSPTFSIIAFMLLILWLTATPNYNITKPKTFTPPHPPATLLLLNILLLIALYLTPFYLTIFLGEHPVFRAQLVLPFTTGFMLYLICTLIYRQEILSKEACPFHKPLPPLSGKLCKTAFVAVSILCIWNEADITSRMYYTDALRFEQDLNLAESIARDISKVTEEQDYTGTIVFVGKKPVTYNPTYVKGDVMGQSFFAWDTDAEPVNCWSSHRIVGFMNCMGSHYQAPTQEEATNATALAATMSCYPLEGSIVMNDNLVIVKLSE